MAQFMVITKDGDAYVFTNVRPSNQTSTRPVELENSRDGSTIEGRRFTRTDGQPAIFLEESDFQRIHGVMRPRSRWTLTHTAAAGERGKGPQQSEGLVVEVVSPMEGEQLTLHGREAPSSANDPSGSDSELSELESMADPMEDLAREESAAAQTMAMDVDPPVRSSYPDTLGIVVQTSFNVAHFSQEGRPAAPDENFDPDFRPPEGDPATDETTRRNNEIFHKHLTRREKEIAAGRKGMKIDAILAALRGAKDKGHPIDIASFHEVNDVEEFSTRLRERTSDFGLEIKDGGFDGSGADSGYVLARGPLMKTGTETNYQKENYPLLFNADKFKLEKVRYIPTLVSEKGGRTQPHPDRGVPKDVRGDETLHTESGFSRPLVLYTLKSKKKPGAPPLHVAVVHTKPIGGGKIKGFPGKDRRKIFDQVGEAYQKAQDDAQQTGALWTFVGDHYLANNDLARSDLGGKNPVSVEGAISNMGLQSIDPVADTNTTEKIDKLIHKTWKPKEDKGEGKAKEKKDALHYISVQWGLERDAWLRSGRKRKSEKEMNQGAESNEDEEMADAPADDEASDEESSDEESSDEESSDEESSDKPPPTYLDPEKGDVADKGVITGNLVGSGGIVTLDLRPSRSAPDAPTGPLTEGELAQIDAGDFLANDPDLSALARTVLVSDHAMFVMITSDDPNDAEKIESMFRDAEEIRTSIAEAYASDYTEGTDAGSYTADDAYDSEREAKDARLDAKHEREIAKQMAALYEMPAQSAPSGNGGDDSSDDSSDGSSDDSSDDADDDAMDVDAPAEVPAKKRKREGDEGSGRPSSSAPHGFSHPSANAGGNQVTLAFRSGPGNASGSHKRHGSSAGRRR